MQNKTAAFSQHHNQQPTNQTQQITSLSNKNPPNHQNHNNEDSLSDQNILYQHP